MKKIKKLSVFSFLVFFLFVTKVFAVECTSEETNKLNSLAVNVKASYEIMEIEKTDFSSEFNPPDGIDANENITWYDTVIRVYITNLTEDLYITVTNDQTKEVKTYRYEDATNGTITFDQTDFSQITNYTITVYSSSNTNCANNKLYTLYLTTPMYNTLYEYSMCEGIEEFYLCHEYLSVNVSTENFFELATKYKEGKINSDGEEIKDEPSENDKGFTEFLKEYKSVIIIVAVLIIAGGGLVTVIIVKKQRSRII